MVKDWSEDGSQESEIESIPSQDSFLERNRQLEILCQLNRIFSSALPLHFIQRLFPNRFQFGSEKNPKIFENFFRTDSNSVWHFWHGFVDNFSERTPVRFGKIILTFEQKNSKLISVQFGANTYM